jgi:magnesium chelatase subunit I
LDEWLPIVEGSEIRDDPFAPISAFATELVAQKGDETPVAWIHRSQRFAEKLASPDTSMADLIGEVDPIKVAGGLFLDDPKALSYGLVPKSNRGIFAMNELPDLAERIQVGLLNVLEERDVQIRGFTVRLALDVCMVFSANPEDYTNRGRIVTPLKDRIGSVVRTHYPLTRELGMQITDANAWREREDGPQIAIPKFLKEIVEETSRLARTSPHVNQASGVSVRMSIANYENLISNTERRALALGEEESVARVSDLVALIGSSRGKIELNMTEETGEEDKLLGRIVEEAVKSIFDQHFDPKQFRNIVEYFESGNTLEVGDRLPAVEILKKIDAVREFRKQVAKAAGELDPQIAATPLRPQLEASVAEFILDGLYCHNRLNKKQRSGMASYGR